MAGRAAGVARVGEVRVRVAGDGTDSSGWSEPATVEAGLLHPEDWTARFVSPVELGGLDAPAPVLGAAVRPAGRGRARPALRHRARRLRGVAQRHAGSATSVLAPGWTAYQHRLRYQTYDVTDLLRQGENELEVLLGNGWYRGRLGFRGKRALYGDRLALLAQLEVTTTDGAVHVLATDGSWTARESGIVADDLYDGQRTDLRHGAGPRSGPGRGGRRRPRAAGRARGPPVRVTEVLPAVEVFALAVGCDARRLRPERRRLGPAARSRARGRDGGRRPARRGARGRRAGRPAAAQRRRRPTATSWPAVPRRCSSRA